MGCKVLNYGSGGTSAALDAYYPTFGGVSLNAASTVEPRTETTEQLNKTFSGLFAYVSANGHAASATLRFRKNGASGNQSVTIGAGLTGLFRDSTNSDVLVSGDKSNLLYDRPGGTSSTAALVGIFSDTGKTATARVGIYGSMSLSAASTNNTIPCAGNLRTGVDSIVGRIPATRAYTAKNMSVYIVSNARGTACTVKMRKGGADAGPTITVGAGLSGYFEDTTNTASFAITDQCSYYFVTGTGSGSIVSTVISHDQEFADNTYMQYACEITGRSVNGATTQYMCTQGLPGVTTTEPVQQVRMTGSGSFSGLAIYVSANSATVGQDYTIRKNGVDTSLVLTVPSTSTGYFQNTTDSVSYADGDLISIKISRSGGTGAVTHRYYTLNTTASTGFTPQTIFF